MDRHDAPCTSGFGVSRARGIGLIVAYLAAEAFDRPEQECTCPAVPQLTHSDLSALADQGQRGRNATSYYQTNDYR